jgi:hypothetical protein
MICEFPAKQLKKMRRDPVREAYVLRFGIPRTRKHILWLSAARLEQLGRCKSDECRRLILGTSK